MLQETASVTQREVSVGYFRVSQVQTTGAGAIADAVVRLRIRVNNSDPILVEWTENLTIVVPAIMSNPESNMFFLFEVLHNSGAFSRSERINIVRPTNPGSTLRAQLFKLRGKSSGTNLSFFLQWISISPSPSFTLSELNGARVRSRSFELRMSRIINSAFPHRFSSRYCIYTDQIWILYLCQYS